MAERLRIGDKVVVPSSDQLVPPRELTIAEDGTLELPVVGKVVAAGKTPKQLEVEIEGLLNANRDRYYIVEGAVYRPGPKLFVAPTDLIHAIEFEGGGMTSYADKKAGVKVVRPNGKTLHVNYRRELTTTNKFLIHPGDRIVVSSFGN